MSRINIAREKAKGLLSESKFEEIDKYINSIPVPGTKKADLWENFLKGEMILNTWIDPTNCSDEDIMKINEDIKERGKEAILELIDNQRMLPKNLREHLRRNYSKELSEIKEIIHRRKFSIN